jgi:hypothetical protein
MPDCPYCNVIINEAYNFCVNCEQQVKCIACGSYLIKDKSKCLKCGTPLSASQTIATPMNNFSLEEEQSDNNFSRKLNACLTDAAIDKVASVLSGYVPLTPPKSPTKHVTQPHQQLDLPFLQTSANNGQLDQSVITDDETVETTAKSISDNNSASDYFDKDKEGFLISNNHDYKGKNKKLQQQRFSILYVWAYNALNGEAVPNDHLTQAAQRNGVYDKNYPTYLKEASNRFFTRLNDTFKINPSGRAEVSKIQAEMQDSDLSGSEYWNPTRKKSNRSPRVNKEDEQRIEQWIQMPSKFVNFDVRELKTTYELAIFALYDITKELKVETAVKPSLAYEYLTKRYKTVSISNKNFSNVLSDKKYKKYFEHTSEGLYYLTQEAESLAESWISKGSI